MLAGAGRYVDGAGETLGFRINVGQREREAPHTMAAGRPDGCGQAIVVVG